MCICINCVYVQQCSTYKFVTIQHNGNNNSSIKNIFEPSYSVLQVNYSDINNHLQIDWDVIECLSFLEDPGSWTNPKFSVEF
uniref:Uncharacterized protein n=1 Tax=Titanophycus setchellii TaxID=940129 RepID=A0A1G4NYH2_9FLOR|nr:Hypothetical protein ycf34 [Titanophycus setchellii]SCW23566.1 Hypothetical protein ycf34 [Titanophycus setchellii]